MSFIVDFIHFLTAYVYFRHNFLLPENVPTQTCNHKPRVFGVRLFHSFALQKRVPTVTNCAQRSFRDACTSPLLFCPHMFCNPWCFYTLPCLSCKIVSKNAPSSDAGLWWECGLFLCFDNYFDLNNHQFPQIASALEKMGYVGRLEEDYGRAGCVSEKEGRESMWTAINNLSIYMCKWVNNISQKKLLRITKSALGKNKIKIPSSELLFIWIIMD